MTRYVLTIAFEASTVAQARSKASAARAAVAATIHSAALQAMPDAEEVA